MREQIAVMATCDAQTLGRLPNTSRLGEIAPPTHVGEKSPATDHAIGHAHQRTRPAVRRTGRVERLTRALNLLGPTYVKFGQVLSTRPDIVPSEYVAALESLQDAVEPFSFAEVEKIVEQELGARISKIFREFEPISSAGWRRLPNRRTDTRSMAERLINGISSRTKPKPEAVCGSFWNQATQPRGPEPRWRAGLA